MIGIANVYTSKHIFDDIGCVDIVSGDNVRI